MGRTAPLVQGLAALALALVVTLSRAAGDAPTVPEPSPRDRLRAERAQVDAHYADREQACRARFAVSGCLQAAAASRREALTRLRRQEVDLDEAERRDWAAARRARVDARAGAAASAATPIATEAAPSSVPPRGRASTPATAAPAADESATEPFDAALPGRAPRPAQPPRMPTPPRVARPVVDRSAQDAAERAAFERKQQQAAAHRDAVERRNAELAKSGKPAAAPLPVPDALRQ